MKKYLYIFKSELMSSLSYVLNIIFGFIGSFIILFIFLNLWQYIYSDPNELINGYSMNQMIWYVVITEILWGTLGERKYCLKICNNVKAGNVAYNINKPYNYVLYELFTHLGDISIKFILYFILGLFTGILFLHSLPAINVLSIIIVIVSMILALIINTLIITAISLFSFFIEDAQPFYWIYSKINLILGTIFPIEYFPKFLQPILRYSPIYVVSYGPAKLFVDFSWTLVFRIIGVQLIYLIIGYSICLLIYKKGVKKLNVNGG